jgi:Leucine-rich repeat (LRR) protein
LNLKKLEVFKLGGYASLINIPKEIGKLINLRHLELTQLSNHKLPIEIANLENLEYLELTSCPRLETIPSEIGELKNLKELKLEDLDIKTLPKEIGKLLKLEYLEISSCSELEIIPSEIGELKNLKELKLNYLDIKALPKEIGNLSKLENLKLSDCGKLEIIPSEIGKLQELKHLDISWNTSLTELPKEVGSLVNLTHLNFRHSGLEKLPDELSILKKLKFLNDEPYIMLNKKEETPMKEIAKNKIDNKKLGNIDFPHKNILLKGVPGTGKSHTLENIIKNDLKLKNDSKNICHINIHSASSNADLMQGIGINSNGGKIEYKEKQGLIYNHIKKALFTPNQPFVLVLEEIQENSLNELIGDLIYLIEEKKRVTVNSSKFEDEKEYAYQEFIEKVLEEEENRHSIEIPYLVDTSTAYRKMVLPSNLYVFCTSNYRDDKKVIEDNLLRRFDVVEIYPKYEVCKSDDIAKFLEKLNDEILKQFKQEIHPDRYLVGHANWLDITDEESDENRELFYTALLKVIIEFKEIREVDFDGYVKPILKKLFESGEYLSERIEDYLKECELDKLESYKELVEKLQSKIYPFL